MRFPGKEIYATDKTLGVIQVHESSKRSIILL